MHKTVKFFSFRQVLYLQARSVEAKRKVGPQFFPHTVAFPPVHLFRSVRSLQDGTACIEHRKSLPNLPGGGVLHMFHATTVLHSRATTTLHMGHIPMQGWW